MLSVTAFIQNALNVDVHILTNKCERTKDYVIQSSVTSKILMFTVAP